MPNEHCGPWKGSEKFGARHHHLAGTMKNSPRREHRRSKPVEVAEGDFTVDVKTLTIEVPRLGLVRQITHLGLLIDEPEHAEALRCIAAYSLRYSKSTASGRINYLKRLLRELHTNYGSKQEIGRQISDGKTLSEIINDLTAKSRLEVEPSTFNERAKELNAILRELTSCGLIREAIQIKTVRGARRKSVPRPDLIALNPHLAVGLSKPDSPNGIAEQQLQIYGDTLVTLRRALEREYLKAKQQFEEGQKLISQASPNVVETFQAAQKLGGRAETKALQLLFPEDNDEIALANLLKIYRDCYQLKPGKGKKGNFHAFMSTQVKRFGGAEALTNLLTLGTKGIVAAAAHLQVERNVNPSLLFPLEVDYESPSDDANHVLIHAIKRRVGPEEIPLLLPLAEEGWKVTSASALRGVLECNQWVRDTYPDLSKKLFAYISYQGPTTLTQETYAKYLEQIGKSCGLRRLLSSSIRPTGAVRALSNGDMHTVAQELQQAPESTSTAGYIQGAQSMLVARIRDYQENLQIGIAAGVPGALEALGYRPSEIELLKSKAKRTGLGFFCRNPDDAPSKNPTDGECNDVGRCSRCKVKLFVADPLSIAEQIAIDQILTSRMEELSSEEPQRWESVWVHMLAFARVAIQRVQSSYYARHMREANQLAKQLIEAGYDPTELKL